MDNKAITTDKLELLARIASLYFEEGLGQSAIAAQTGYSRSMISRLLAEAREYGVVEIRVHHPLARRTDLEQDLQVALGLKIVRVLRSGTLSYPQMLRQLGSLAARLVEDLVYDNITVGVSWGTAVWETVHAVRSGAATGAHVVQMIGSLGTPDPDIDGPELARRLARSFIGHYSTLPAPLIVDSETTRQALMEDQRIQRVTAFFKGIELALVGVGTITPERSSLLRAAYLTVQQLEELERDDVVGDVCAIHFTRDGRLLDSPLTRRIIGIDAATLAAVPLKIGVAGGQSKSLPIIGATRAGLINIVVTDEVAAVGILEELKRDGQANVWARNGKQPA